MSKADLAELVKLTADERADLATALWESLTDEQRDAELELGQDDRAERDRRWAKHLAEPESAIPWSAVRRKLRDDK